jgi:hypothetical protein
LLWVVGPCDDDKIHDLVTSYSKMYDPMEINSLFKITNVCMKVY